MPNATHTYQLPPAVTIDTVAKLATDISKLDLPEGSSLVLDASQTEIITTPGVQLLISIGKWLEKKHARFHLSNPKETISLTFQALGLETQLKEWSNTNG